MQKILQSSFSKIFLITLLVIIAFTGLAYLTYGKTIVGGDDANITFVYSRNFADGHGFVYNIGGERVEGFSSFLWTVIVAGVYKIFNNFNFVLLLINILSLSLSISYLLHTLYRIFLKENNSKTKILFLLGILLTWITAVPNYIVWGTITLMEFGLYSSLLITTLTVILRILNKLETRKEIFLFHVLISLLVLIRPESMLWGIVFIFLYFVAQWYNSNFKNALKKGSIAFLVFIITLGSLIGFRVVYFGYPLPNTYYAKVSIDTIYNLKQGFIYITNFVNSNSIAFIFIGIALTLLVVSFFKIVLNLKQRTKPSIFELNIFVITLIILTGIFIPIYNGGDQFNQYRFIQPIWPFLILPFLFTLSLINFQQSFVKEKLYALFAGLIIIFCVLYNSDVIVWHKIESQYYQTMAPQFDLSLDDLQNGRDFNGFFKPLDKLPSLAVVAAGAIKMSYLGDANDLLGLNNVEMAHANPIKVGIKNHAAFEKSVFYKQKPELLNLDFVESFTPDETAISLEEYWNSILKNLYKDEEFNKEYTRAVVLSKDLNKYLFGHFRNDLIQKLDSSKFEVRVLSDFSG